MSADFCIHSTLFRSKTCEFTEDGIQVYFQGFTSLVPYESLLLFRYDEKGQLVLQTELPESALASARALYQPLSLIHQKEPSDRMKILFN